MFLEVFEFVTFSKKRMSSFFHLLHDKKNIFEKKLIQN